MKRFISIIVLLLSLTACASITAQRPDDLTFAPLEFDFPQVSSRQLDNGMRVYIKENHELPLVDLSIMVEGGSIYDPPGKAGLSKLFAELLQSGGSENLSPEEVESELENNAISFSVSSSSYAYEINLSMHRQELERGLTILADIMKWPRFDDNRLEVARKQMLEALYRKNDEPGPIASRLLEQTLNPGHPFGRFPEVDAVKAFTRDDLVDLHQRFFNPKNVWIAISGDVSEADIVDSLAEKFDHWSDAPELLSDIPNLPPPPEGRVLVVDKDVPQTTILMGHRGISKDNPDIMALKVANYILGGGGFNSRLMREVRSNRGLAYSVYSYFQTGRYLPGLFVASSETKSSSTVEVAKLMRELITRITSEPVSENELNLAKKSLMNSFVFAFDDCHSIVSRKMRLDYYDYPEGYLETYREKIAAVTVEEVQRVAAKYFQPDMLQVVLVGDSRSYQDDVQKIGLPVEQISLDQIQ